MFRRLAITLFSAITLIAASNVNLQLDGHIDSDVPARSLRVTLFSVERPYAESADVDHHGDFHFRNLAPGNYTVAVVRDGMGEVRRTVVVSSAVAGNSGVVRAVIPYSSTEAAANPAAGTVSVHQASIPRHAAAKYAELEFSASFDKSRLMETYQAELRKLQHFQWLIEDAESREKGEGQTRPDK